MKVWDVPWRLRAQPASERYPAAATEMRVVVTLDSQSYGMFRRLRDRVFDARTETLKLKGAELAGALNEMHVFMELHYYTEARLLSADEGVARGLVAEEATTGSAALMEDMAERGFKIPASVLRDARVGQTSLLDERIGPNVPRPESDEPMEVKRVDPV